MGISFYQFAYPGTLELNVSHPLSLNDAKKFKIELEQDKTYSLLFLHPQGAFDVGISISKHPWALVGYYGRTTDILNFTAITSGIYYLKVGVGEKHISGLNLIDANAYSLIIAEVDGTNLDKMSLAPDILNTVIQLSCWSLGLIFISIRFLSLINSKKKGFETLQKITTQTEEAKRYSESNELGKTFNLIKKTELELFNIPVTQLLGSNVMLYDDIQIQLKEFKFQIDQDVAKTREEIIKKTNEIKTHLTNKEYTPAYDELIPILEICRELGVWDLYNELHKLYAELKIRITLIDISTKYPRLQIEEIAKLCESDVNYTIKILENMFQNQEMFGEYFEETGGAVFEVSKNMPFLTMLDEAFKDWEDFEEKIDGKKAN